MGPGRLKAVFLAREKDVCLPASGVTNQRTFPADIHYGARCFWQLQETFSLKNGAFGFLSAKSHSESLSCTGMERRHSESLSCTGTERRHSESLSCTGTERRHSESLSCTGTERSHSESLSCTGTERHHSESLSCTRTETL
ncbi:hypothetical protein VZT92_023802 [Zoarces viviparus]|uniref:Uncharacterized protein n=1 Tax=Zoarces viviparus TaxID=48416 RepID=A0AAW1E7B5_ZOAVI